MAIQMMSADLSNKIAAGEVVERPRSIVKEFVENALDAKADQIKIYIKNAGIQEIIVEDNGVGMDESDAILAFQRHATSKIFTEHDLFQIQTLGFRGEALAAIASVSKVHLHTGKENQPSTHVYIDSGEVQKKERANSRVGTKITARQLFYNTPARLKHLKALKTEYIHTTEYLQKMALARPDVRFEFVSDEKLVFQTFGSGNLSETLVMIYGNKIVNDLLPISVQDNDFKVTGIITKPQSQRAHNRVINLAINERSVRSFGINRAIVSGYGHLLPKGMYPIVALNIQVDSKLVDVNVHPAKLEVRISQEKQLETLICQKVRDVLSEANLIVQNPSMPRQIKTTAQNSIEFSNQVLRAEQDLSESKANKNTLRENKEIYSHQEQTQILQEKNTNDYHVNKSEDVKLSDKERTILSGLYDVSAVTLPDEVTDTIEKQVEHEQVNVIRDQQSQHPQQDRVILQELAIIGQFDATYIIGQYQQSLYLIDQHAAQERIKYDAHMNQVKSLDKIAIQELLFPLIIELERREAIQIQDLLATFLQTGIELEFVSDTAVRIITVPHWIQQENIEKYVRRAITVILENTTVDNALIREEKLIMLSCKYSIKAHDVLNMHEMQTLLQQLSVTTTPFTCPHGHPIIVKQTLAEIERWFKRV